jgi:acyl-CoA thioesterase
VAEGGGGEQPTRVGKFDRDTIVWRESAVGSTTVYGGEVSGDWQAGRGPHGGYLAAMLLRALADTVDDPERSARSLTIHYARAPTPGRVQISTVLEREGRSLSTLSARMEQGGKLIALVLAAFSIPWSGPEISDLEMPDVEPADRNPRSGAFIDRGAPLFTKHIIIQPRLEGVPFAGGEQPMEITGWLGLAEPRPIDARVLAFLSDALIPAPFMRTAEPLAAPTVDLTVHFRAPLHKPDPKELCLVRTRTNVIHDGFFEEDGWIWAPDGTLLAQSRQLAILLPMPMS